MFSALFREILDVIYPPKCGICGVLGPEFFCSHCVEKLKPAPELKLHDDDGRLDAVIALFAFDDTGAEAVKRLKYSRVTSLGIPMGDMMRENWDKVDSGAQWLVIPVPISARRRRERGFNQSELLAERFDGYSPEILKRTRHTLPQAGLKAAERLTNLNGAFEVKGEVSGRSILLVDDVVTTGGTLVECARTLKNEGAAEVRAITFCGEKSGF